MRLVGVEYVVFDGDEATDEPPVFPGGASFHPTGGHGGPVLSTLHAYVRKHNPAGMFADFNPRNSCR